MFEGFQRKLRRNFGRDSHVRSVDQDIFKVQSTQVTQLHVGQIIISQPEPAFRQTAVTVELTQGGTLTGVAYPGAFIDPLSGNLHGVYEGPIPGQMVAVGFVNGNSSAPMVVNRYPYQAISNPATEAQYVQPMTRKLYDSTDTLIGHFSGSVIRFNTGILSGKLPGSITIESVTDCDIESNTRISISAPVGITITGGLISISNQVQSMKSLIDDLITEIKNLKTFGSPTNHTVSPDTVALLDAWLLKWAQLMED